MTPTSDCERYETQAPSPLLRVLSPNWHVPSSGLASALVPPTRSSSDLRLYLNYPTSNLQSGCIHAMRRGGLHDSDRGQKKPALAYMGGNGRHRPCRTCVRDAICRRLSFLFPFCLSASVWTVWNGCCPPYCKYRSMLWMPLAPIQPFPQKVPRIRPEVPIQSLCGQGPIGVEKILIRSLRGYNESNLSCIFERHKVALFGQLNFPAM